MSEKLKIKIYRAKMHTAGKTKEQLLKDFDGPEPDEQLAQNYIKAFDLIDGIEVFVADGFATNDNDYSLIGWDDKADPKMKEFIYLMEQDPFMGTYVDKREQFDKDWDSKEYEPPAAIHFEKDDVEILEDVTKKG